LNQQEKRKRKMEKWKNGEMEKDMHAMILVLFVHHARFLKICGYSVVVTPHKMRRATKNKQTRITSPPSSSSQKP